MAGLLCVLGQPASAASEVGAPALSPRTTVLVKVLGPARQFERKSFLGEVWLQLRRGGAVNKLLSEAQSDGGPIGELCKECCGGLVEFRFRYCAVY